LPRIWHFSFSFCAFDIKTCVFPRAKQIEKGWISIAAKVAYEHYGFVVRARIL
jgi:hypothetical protein